MNDLTLVCEACRFPILYDKGSLYVREGDLRDAREARAEWEKAHPSGSLKTGADLLTYPEPVRWRSAHDACRSDHGEGCYEIDEPQIRSWAQAVRWTADLMGKRWLGMTDWDDLLRELSGEIPAQRVRVNRREAA